MNKLNSRWDKWWWTEQIGYTTVWCFYVEGILHKVTIGRKPFGYFARTLI
jgi:hypothetical protein